MTEVKKIIISRPLMSNENFIEESNKIKKRGRPNKYTPEEAADKQRQWALNYYYKKNYGGRDDNTVKVAKIQKILNSLKI